MSPLETIRLVAGREITTRIRSKAFLWTTGLLVVAIVAGGLILHLALGSSSATAVAVTPQTERLAQPLQAIARANDEAIRIVRCGRTMRPRGRRWRTRMPTRALTGGPTTSPSWCEPSPTPPARRC